MHLTQTGRAPTKGGSPQAIGGYFVVCVAGIFSGFSHLKLETEFFIDICQHGSNSKKKLFTAFTDLPDASDWFPAFSLPEIP